MRRRQSPREIPSKLVADYERAGQQCLPGIPPLRQHNVRAGRLAAQTLAVTEHAANLVQDLPKTVATRQSQPPLIAEVSRTAGPVTLLELGGHVAPWVIMIAVVSIVIFRATVSEVSYAVRITGVPKQVVVGFLGLLAIPASAAATWPLWRRLSAAIKRSDDRLARIARAVVIAAVLVVAQVPSFITYTQSYEAAWYVATSIYRAVVNALTLPHFDTGQPQRPLRKP